MPMRRFVVSRSEAGKPLAALLCARLSLAWPEAKQLIRQRHVYLAGAPCPDPNRRVQPGQRVEIKTEDKQPSKHGHKQARHPPPGEDKARPANHSGPKPTICYADAHVVVVDKPAGLTTMRHPGEAAEFGARGRRFLPPTLADVLPAMLKPGRSGKPPRVRAVHRLDKETSGLVVFALAPAAESHLGKQFRAHSVERCYFAVVRGRARSGRIESWLVQDRGDGRRGSGPRQGEGRRAVTHVRVVEPLGDYTLVECRLETGRT